MTEKEIGFLPRNFPEIFANEYGRFLAFDEGEESAFSVVASAIFGTDTSIDIFEAASAGVMADCAEVVAFLAYVKAVARSGNCEALSGNDTETIAKAIRYVQHVLHLAGVAYKAAQNNQKRQPL